MSATPSADIPQFEIDSGPGSDDVFVVRIAGEADMSHEEELRASSAQRSRLNRRGSWWI